MRAAPSLRLTAVHSRKHLYTDMDRISRIWEIELQAVLEINKLGHRKRILYSVGATSPKTEKQMMASLNRTTGSFNKASTATNSNGSADNLPEQRRSHRKNRQAPKPPNFQAPAADGSLDRRDSNLEIRAPAELLLGFPTGLSTQWRHPADTLVNDSVKYEVNVSSPPLRAPNRAIIETLYYSTWGRRW